MVNALGVLFNANIHKPMEQRRENEENPCRLRHIFTEQEESERDEQKEKGSLELFDATKHPSSSYLVSSVASSASPNRRVTVFPPQRSIRMALSPLNGLCDCIRFLNPF